MGSILTLPFRSCVALGNFLSFHVYNLVIKFMTFKNYTRIQYIRQITKSSIKTHFYITTLMGTWPPHSEDLKQWQFLPGKGENQTWAFTNSATNRKSAHHILLVKIHNVHQYLITQIILTVKKFIWFCLTWYFLNFFDPLFFANNHFASWKMLF